MRKISILTIWLCCSIAFGQRYLQKIDFNSISELEKLTYQNVIIRYISQNSAIIESTTPLSETEILDLISDHFAYFLIPLKFSDRFDGEILETFGNIVLIKIPISETEKVLKLPTHFRAELPTKLPISPNFAPQISWISHDQQLEIKHLLNQVSVERWFSSIEQLSRNEDLDQIGHFFNSRYALRVRNAKQLDGKPQPDHACDNAADWIAQQFRQIGLEVELDPFEHRRSKIGEGLLGEYEMRNVVATLNGSGSNRDRSYILTAHYDSIATKTENWGENWQTLIAPGSSDNASGVAILIEVARLLSQIELDFSVKFIAFSGEELFLHGSKHYTQNVIRNSDEIAGVLNFDLIGHDEDGSLDIHVLGDWQSQWLVSAFETVADRYQIPIELVLKNDPSFIFSDHSPFWEIGVSAVMISEESSFDGGESVEYIHSEADNLEKITLPLGELAIKLAVATTAELARFSDSDQFQPIETQKIPIGHSLVIRPNPIDFSQIERAEIELFLNSNATAKIAIYSLVGELIRETDHEFQKGLNQISWRGENFVGERIASGIYFVKIDLTDRDGNVEGFRRKIAVLR